MQTSSRVVVVVKSDAVRFLKGGRVGDGGGVHAGENCSDYDDSDIDDPCDIPDDSSENHSLNPKKNES